MCGAIKRKTMLIVGLLAILLSIVINAVVSSDVVVASSPVYDQSYISVTEMYRSDDELYITLKDDLLVKNMTYEYTHYVNEILESDLVVTEPKKLSDREYMIKLPEGTKGIKLWKVMHQIENDYYKNKFAQGDTAIGDLGSIRKKNYITVTSDALVAYEYECDDLLNQPWYMYIGPNSGKLISDYLFKKNVCANYTWHFNIDREIDSIIDVNITYATFEYSEIFWGAVESQHNYQSHGPVKIKTEQEVYDFEKLVDYAENKCNWDFAGGTCNNKLKNENEELFKRNAIGVSGYIDNDGNSYDWYVQVALNDLLEENNWLWGAYENKTYLQEVTLLDISYYFEGQEYFDVNVLDEDTGEIIDIIPDPSPLDKLVALIDDVADWISENWKTALIILCVGIILVVLVIKFGFKLIAKIVESIALAIWFILKWTIFLPITLPYRIIKNRKIEKKKQEDFDKLMANHKRNLEKKNTTRGKKL